MELSEDQKKRGEIIDKIVALIIEFNKTKPNDDEDNLNALVIIASTSIKGESVKSEGGEELEKPVKRVSAIIGKREDVMNATLQTIFSDDGIYDYFKEATAIAMNSKFDNHINKLKNFKNGSN